MKKITEKFGKQLINNYGSSMLVKLVLLLGYSILGMAQEKIYFNKNSKQKNNVESQTIIKNQDLQVKQPIGPSSTKPASKATFIQKNLKNKSNF